MTKRYPFSLRLRVRRFDCDGQGRLRTACALRYVQEAAGGHLESLGFGFQKLKEEGMFFVLIGQGLRILRTPREGELLTVATAPVPAHGARMFRETVLLDEGGNLLAENQTAWALLDFETGRPLRSSSFRHELPALGGVWTPFIDPSRIRIPEAQEPCGGREVRLSDLDVNRHMNNTVYADAALDCFPEELLCSAGVDTLLLRYQHQARLGETISLRRGRKDNCFRVSGSIGNSACFSAEFSLKALATEDHG